MWKKVFHRVKAPEGGGMTKWLFFSISVCVFGNSFLYGYNIGVVNSPALIIKTFYSQVYLARDGIETVFNPQDKGLHYVDPARYVNTTTPAVVVVDNNSNTTADNSTALSDNSTKGTYAVETTTVRPVSMAKTETEINEDNFIELLWSLTVALFVFFGMVGAFASGRVADYFGRKKGMIIITVLMFFAAMFGGITTIAKSPECLMISRIFVGLHNGVSVSLASLYLAEISPRSIRGAVGTCHQLFITVGILWSQVLGLPDISGGWGVWPWLFAFNALPALACLVLFPLCPESPRYLLIKKADEDGAKKALVKLRGYDNVEEEMEEMRVEARRASSVEQFTLKKLLTTPELKLPIIIACTLQVAQQWSGINAAMSYSTFIFKQATIPENTIPYVIVGQGAVNVLATIVCVPLMEKLGRRPLLIFPMCGMVISFLVLTICLTLLQSGDYDDSKKILGIVCIVVMMTYIIGFAVGLGPIPFIVCGEIFRQEPRAAAMSLSLAFNWICNFILMLSFRFIQKAIESYTYLIFIVILVAAIIFIVIFVPETKNKTFDEIAQSIAFGRGARRPAFNENGGEELQPMGDQKI
ncbi:solute carrier family 2, facilitated glucose transporter member 1-like isoform X2 [Mya arenaria]|uniref:solute carrier family 2, facilitated glucose transporter member 1-like isoform X2 n=1 Tax=Mya arenaria TaxID=6604 RepID=UPI0022E3F41E|nr:solute carrier family 2, facilitated glucose transporter member 1-like isoform X2 [Mya arenaria]XP_052761206.1 solute carrier family 2, facilitated glucose transporter member 1-like isoform X2 [Mya arenaria]XP_052761207.1 solute carrier family 2, facilitated glucose transporter member 1-like isoform X2 [Mya arenaria]XP_052761208.1 solute carrier family 2, facilitated glucose transporter member 1-like isoform X2 [Mya arenaria]